MRNMYNVPNYHTGHVARILGLWHYLKVLYLMIESVLTHDASWVFDIICNNPFHLPDCQKHRILTLFLNVTLSICLKCCQKLSSNWSCVIWKKKYRLVKFFKAAMNRLIVLMFFLFCQTLSHKRCKPNDSLATHSISRALN